MRFDLHIHSKYSGDSKVVPREIVKKAERIGLDGIAVMDHNTLKGYRHIRDMDTSLIIVPGIEVSTPAGHVIGLGLQEEIGRRSSVGEAVDVIREHGALVLAPHPHRYWSGIGEEGVLNNEFDAIEGLNGRSWKSKNIKAQRMAEKIDLPMIGGSDAHRLKTVGKSFTIVNDVDDWEDVLDEVKDGRTNIGGAHRTLIQSFSYVRRAIFGWIGRGFKRI